MSERRGEGNVFFGEAHADASRRSISFVIGVKRVRPTSERSANGASLPRTRPCPPGHDRFDYSLVRRLLGEPVPGEVLSMLGGGDRLNMSLLALNLSRFVNGVARRHREVSEQMFPGQDIRHITNGVHSFTWTSDGFRELSIQQPSSTLRLGTPLWAAFMPEVPEASKGGSGVLSQTSTPATSALASSRS